MAKPAMMNGMITLVNIIIKGLPTICTSMKIAGRLRTAANIARTRTLTV